MYNTVLYVLQVQEDVSCIEEEDGGEEVQNSKLIRRTGRKENWMVGGNSVPYRQGYANRPDVFSAFSIFKNFPNPTRKLTEFQYQIKEILSH